MLSKTIDFADVILKTLHVATDGFLITDPHQDDNPIVFASKSFIQQTGYHENEILGQNCRFLQGKDSDQGMIKKIQSAIKNKKPFKGVILNYRKDGSPFWNLVCITPIFDANNNLLCFSGVQTDITELKHTQELVEQQKVELAHFGRLHQVDKMSASIFHELKQPLSALMNYINGLTNIDKNNLPEHIKSALIAMKEQIYRTNDMITHFNYYTKKKSVERAKGDINELVEHAVYLLSHDLIDIDVTTTVSKIPPYVVMDKLQLLQVVTNIIQNAIEAMRNISNEETKKLAILTNKIDNKTVRITIHNNGPRITEGDIKHLFEPFYTTKKNGTGIGLALAHRIIEMHGGKISVKSNAAEGTTFTIDLPLLTNNESTKTSSSSTPSQLPL
ncbi:MAG: PAS domain-containing protein [Gammaproteobacteria bacterium]|nr:PAS domain-containing protein [Gammaproteobacteria bacterium]MCH9743359.1 PAS domain-containing protein [Gammaproteobacteria bacterium]